MSAKCKTIEAIYKTGLLDRYAYQDALACLHATGVINDGEYNRLNDEAAADGILDME